MAGRLEEARREMAALLREAPHQRSWAVTYPGPLGDRLIAAWRAAGFSE
jgi:hypothetical protein